MIANMNPMTQEAYDLTHQGALELVRCEQHGMRVDVKKIQKQKKKINKQIAELEVEFKKTKFFKRWDKSIKGNVNIYSADQMREFIYEVEGHPVEKRTKKGLASTDNESLSELGISDLAAYNKIGKLKTLQTTFLPALENEAVDGIVHPFFHLHIPISYRGCIAKGMKVLVMRDFKKTGVPIEAVKKGDHVYCFDDKLKPAIRQVEWAGKTGHMEVIRVHWSSKGKHGKGYLDCTPDHKIRLIDGTYVAAENLMQDFRTEEERKLKYPKVRTLSCFRDKDTLNFTGHLKNGHGIYEHQLIFETFKRKLKEGEIVHHRDENHYNHMPTNLMALTKSAHALLHVEDTLCSKKSRKKNKKVLKKNWRKGKYAHTIKSGFANSNSLRLTKYACLRLLFEAGGKLTKVDHDFATFKHYLELYEINPKTVSLLFDKNGEYISQNRFQQLSEDPNISSSEIREQIGHNFYRFKELASHYNTGNHIITHIEKLNKKVDVYDLTVKDYNNFIVNEICVHNSSAAPNFQNFPKRDVTQMNVIRSCIVPSKGNQLLELDYSQIEVRCGCANHQDPTMIEYCTNPTSDMHRDMAMQIFKLKKYNSDNKMHKHLRNATKNGFVFPAFYGDYHVGFAKSIASEKWLGLPKYNTWKKADGVLKESNHIAKHLIKHDLDHLGLPKYEGKQLVEPASGFTQHLKEIEQHFWKKRFPVYDAWKDEWYEEYLKKGYFYNKTGFTFNGIMNKKDCSNYPVQSAAFHVLLWAMTELSKALRRDRMRTRIIGQIHDAIVFDVYPPELDRVITLGKCIMQHDTRQRFKWINVPLPVEAELCPVDAAWNKKADYKIH